MYTYNDIKWIKNVTADKGANWAYMEEERVVGNIFWLHFPNNPKWYPTNYEKAKPGELLVLFQTVKNEWYVTHLVTPVDNIVIHDEHPSHPYRRLVCIVGKPDTSFLIDNKIWSFFKPNRGQVCNISKIEKRKDDITIDEKKRFIWDIFQQISPEFDIDIKELQTPCLDPEINGVEEGAEVVILKLHKFRERDKSIINKIKEDAKKGNKLFCEVCGFNFEKIFPILGDGFIECHHKQPISDGIRITNPTTDLAIVCSNCHRMLHRKYENKYLNVKELKEQFFSDR